MRLQVDVTLRLAAATGRVHTLEAAFDSDAQRLVLHGPSGVGKSATLQAIAGLLRPQRGRIVVGGRTLFDADRGVDVPARRRRIGLVFQDHALFPHLSVAQNVGFALRRWPLPWTPAQRREVHEALERFELAPLASSRPAELSGGQRQRVALARAVLQRPDLLLLDEPFSALDAALRDRLRGELLALQQRLELPMVLVTHDAAEAQTFAQAAVPCWLQGSDRGRAGPAGPWNAAAPPGA